MYVYMCMRAVFPFCSSRGALTKYLCKLRKQNKWPPTPLLHGATTVVAEPLVGQRSTELCVDWQQRSPVFRYSAGSDRHRPAAGASGPGLQRSPLQRSHCSAVFVNVFMLVFFWLFGCLLAALYLAHNDRDESAIPSWDGNPATWL